MWIEIIFAVIAASIVVLVFYIIKALKTAQSSMENINQTLQEVQLEVKQLSEESQKLIVNVQQITGSILAKIEATDALFQSIRQTGESVSQVTGAVKQVSAAVSRNGLLDWAISGVHLWQHWRERKNSKFKGAD